MADLMIARAFLPGVVFVVGIAVIYLTASSVLDQPANS
jgi:hypothetical protein